MSAKVIAVLRVTCLKFHEQWQRADGPLQGEVQPTRHLETVQTGASDASNGDSNQEDEDEDDISIMSMSDDDAAQGEAQPAR